MCEKKPIRKYLSAICVSLCGLMSNQVAFAEHEEMRFTDIALEAGFQDRLSHGRGLIAADFNGDSWTDFLLLNPQDESFILWNNGLNANGSVSYTKGQVLIAGGVSAFDGSAADYDNDGDPDIFIGVGGQGIIGVDYLFRNDNGVFVDVSETANIRGPVDALGNIVPTATSSGTWADYDNDGDLDLFVAYRIIPGFVSEIFPNIPPTLQLPGNLGSRDTLFRNNGDGTFTDVTAASGIQGIFSSMTSSWGDFNNDGWMDLVIPHAIGFGEPDPVMDGYSLYKNNHDGTFSLVPLDLNALAVGSNAFWATAVSDFNNDGWLDIIGFAQSRPEAPFDSHALLINKGNWTFENLARVSGLAPVGEVAPLVMGCQVGDVNSDGFPDVVMGTGNPFAGGVDKLYLTHEGKALNYLDASYLLDYPAPVDPNCNGPDILCNPSYPYRGHAQVFLDIDRDGDLDIAMSRGGTVDALPDVPSTEPNRLFRNDSILDANWLYIELNGTISNTEGVGARIEVKASDPSGQTRKIYKEVKAGSCFSASGPREIHVGLAKFNKIEQITVHWPSGVKTVLDDIGINKRIQINERVIYGSQFNDPESVKNWQSVTGDWRIKHQAYVQSSTGESVTFYRSGASLRDYRVVTKLSYSSGDKTMGLLGRVKNRDNYYAAILVGDKARIYRVDQAKQIPLGHAVQIQNMKPGTSYIVALKFDGDAITLTVDGEDLLHVVDGGIDRGGIGLYADNTVMSADYIAVSMGKRILREEDDDEGEGEESEGDVKLLGQR